jgi:uncharacterized protein YegP (UPF0339 family)
MSRMATSDSNALVTSYVNRIGTPSTTDEVYGYWVFVLGLVLGLLGIGLVVVAEPETALRGAGLGVAAIALLLLHIGPIMRLPLRTVARRISYVGALLGVLATLWFLVAFLQGNWSTTFENREPIIVALYGLSILTMGIGSIVMPLSTDTPEEEGEPDSIIINRGPSEEDLAAAKQRAREAKRRAEEAEQRAKQLAEEQSKRRLLESELHRIADSQSQFEVYTDSEGKHRWRLRHRNRNIIADSAQGYASRQKARQGLSAAKRDAFGATVLDLDRLADGEGEDDPVFVPDAESRALFETYSDADGKHRWRLRHEDGGTIADSPQGYSSSGSRDQAIDYVRHYAQVADNLVLDPAAFELCRSEEGSYRWRLLGRDGSILADSGTRYETRQEARQAIDGFRSRLADTGRAQTHVFQSKPSEAQLHDAIASLSAPVMGLLYQDGPNEWRLRLVYQNGQVVAESGDWFISRSNAKQALERIIGSGPQAEILDIGTAAFEVYEDNSGTWRWRLRHRNGRVMAGCGEGFDGREEAETAITSVRRNVESADVTPVTQGG